jgi:type 1 glutamine amidotransferase
VTTGFRHDSIKTAEQTLARLGTESGAFTVDYVHQPPNEPSEPNKPNPPKAPKVDPDAEKQKAAQEKYEKEKDKYETDLAQYLKDEPKLKEDYKKAKAQWDIEVKRALQKLSPASLRNYDLVIFANTTGDLPLPDPNGFIDWVRQGHAFVATHSGSDTFHGYKPYIEMLGGEFQTHGAQVKVDCIVADQNHPATRHLGSHYNIGDRAEEIYIIKSYNPKTVHELLYLDKHPNSNEPGHYAVSWCKQFGKGKVFYTSLGHNQFVWQREDYQKHLLGGIKWALGLEPGDATPQAK